MANMFVKFLLTICVAGTFGRTVRNQHDNLMSYFPDDDPAGLIPSKWQDFISMVDHKIEDMERRLTEKFSRLNQKRAGQTSETVTAFHASLSGNIVTTDNEVVIYDNETLDHGDGYNPRDGIYTAPGSGTYVITWTTVCYIHTAIQTLLVVNGDVKGSSWTDAEEINDIHQTTAVIVLTLNRGDHVFIRMGPTYGNGAIVSTNGGASWSTFSGWKLD